MIYVWAFQPGSHNKRMANTRRVLVLHFPPAVFRVYKLVQPRSGSVDCRPDVTAILRVGSAFFNIFGMENE